METNISKRNRNQGVPYTIIVVCIGGTKSVFLNFQNNQSYLEQLSICCIVPNINLFFNITLYKWTYNLYLIFFFLIPDPKQWTTAQVHAWIRSTIEQFKLPPIEELEMKFPEDGAALSCLTQDEFHRRASEVSSFQCIF